MKLRKHVGVPARNNRRRRRRQACPSSRDGIRWSAPLLFRDNVDFSDWNQVSSIDNDYDWGDLPQFKPFSTATARHHRHESGDDDPARGFARFRHNTPTSYFSRWGKSSEQDTPKTFTLKYRRSWSGLGRRKQESSDKETYWRNESPERYLSRKDFYLTSDSESDERGHYYSQQDIHKAEQNSPDGESPPGTRSHDTSPCRSKVFGVTWKDDKSKKKPWWYTPVRERKNRKSVNPPLYKDLFKKGSSTSGMDTKRNRGRTTEITIFGIKKVNRNVSPSRSMVSLPDQIYSALSLQSDGRASPQISFTGFPNRSSFREKKEPSPTRSLMNEWAPPIPPKNFEQERQPSTQVSPNTFPSQINKNNVSPIRNAGNENLSPNRQSVNPTRRAKVKENLSPTRHGKVKDNLSPTWYGVSPSKNERVKNAVSPTRNERVKDSVSPTRRERAKDVVSPTRRERAKDVVSPTRKERVKDAVSPTQNVRRGKDVSPIRAPRVTSLPRHAGVKPNVSPMQNAKMNGKMSQAISPNYREHDYPDSPQFSLWGFPDDVIQDNISPTRGRKMKDTSPTVVKGQQISPKDFSPDYHSSPNSTLDMKCIPVRNSLRGRRDKSPSTRSGSYLLDDSPPLSIKGFPPRTFYDTTPRRSAQSKKESAKPTHVRSRSQPRPLKIYEQAAAPSPKLYRRVQAYEPDAAPSPIPYREYGHDASASPKLYRSMRPMTWAGDGPLTQRRQYGERPASATLPRGPTLMPPPVPRKEQHAGDFELPSPPPVSLQMELPPVTRKPPPREIENYKRQSYPPLNAPAGSSPTNAPVYNTNYYIPKLETAHVPDGTTVEQELIVLIDLLPNMPDCGKEGESLHLLSIK